MAAIDDILTLAEAAERLGLSADTLRNQMKRGSLRGRLIGKTYVTTIDEVERYAELARGPKGRPFMGPGSGPVRFALASPLTMDQWQPAYEAIGHVIRQVVESGGTQEDLFDGIVQVANNHRFNVEWLPRDPEGDPRGMRIRVTPKA